MDDPQLPTIGKVMAYVVRDGRLLVFRQPKYPEAGIQVPAGTIETNEEPEAAVLREVAEETGLGGWRLVRKIDSVLFDMRPYKDEIHHRHVFQVDTGDELPETWERLEETAGEDLLFHFFWIDVSEHASLIAGHGDLIPRLLS